MSFLYDAIYQFNNQMEKKIAFIHLNWDPGKLKTDRGRTHVMKGRTLFLAPDLWLDCWDRSPINK